LSILRLNKPVVKRGIMWRAFPKTFDFYLGVRFSRTISMGKESIWQDSREGFILWAYVTGLTLCSPGVRLFPDLAPRVRVVALPAWGPCLPGAPTLGDSLSRHNTLRYFLGLDRKSTLKRPQQPTMVWVSGLVVIWLLFSDIVEEMRYWKYEWLSHVLWDLFKDIWGYLDKRQIKRLRKENGRVGER
jgi:hypothetical protein